MYIVLFIIFIRGPRKCSIFLKNSNNKFLFYLVREPYFLYYFLPTICFYNCNNLGSIYIYQLPQKCSSISDCLIFYHRRFVITESKFSLQSKVKSRPILFNYPLLTVKRDKLDDLLDDLRPKIAQMLTVVPDFLLKENKEKNILNFDEDFTLKFVDEDGHWSNDPDWLTFSNGQQIIQNKTEDLLTKSKYITIDWNLSSYLCKFIPGMENQHSINSSTVIERDPISINYLLHAYFSPDITEDLETKQSITHKLEVTKFPKILLLHLNRAGINSKNQSKIEFGKFLEIPCSSSSSNENDNNKIKYELKGFIVHYGKSMNSGHFISVCKTSNSQWMLFNDSQIEKLTDNGAKANIFEQFQSNVFILAYEKVTTSNEASDQSEQDEEEEDENVDVHEERMRKDELMRDLGRDLDRMEMRTCSIM